MRIDELTATKSKTLSFEFFPAKTEAGWQQWRATAAELAQLQPDFMSVTFGAGGSTRDGTRHGCQLIQDELQIPAMAHLTCVGSSRVELLELLDDYAAAGIENLLALRGDPPKGQSDWRPHPAGLRYASELLQLITADGRFGVACAAFPEGHPDAACREADWDRLADKFRLGACAGISQACFDVAHHQRLRRYLNERHAGLGRVVPGILPPRGWSWVQNFVERFCPNTELPPALRHALEEHADNDAACREAGLLYSLDQCRQLLSDGAPGLHIYTLNEAADTTRIVETLRREGLL